MKSWGRDPATAMRHEPGPIGTYNAPSKDADCENKEVIDEAIMVFWELVTVTVPEMSDTSHGRTALTQLVGAPMGGFDIHYLSAGFWGRAQLDSRANEKNWAGTGDSHAEGACGVAWTGPGSAKLGTVP